MSYKNKYRAIRKKARVLIQKFFPDFGINKFMDNKFLNYAYKKKLGLLKNAEKIELLALRGSGADYDFLDQKTDKSYNLGLTSTDLHATYHLYKFSIDVLPNLKNVLVYFVPIAPGLDLTKTLEKYRYVTYRYFFNIPYQEGHSLKRSVEREIFKKCATLASPSIPESYRGYDKKDYLSSNTDVVARAAAHLRENRREPDQMCWLDALLRLAEKNNHKVWIVVPPVRSDFKKQLPASATLFSKLYAMELGNHEILDFYDDVSFDDSDHGDTDHLNEKGAIKLTNRIMSVLQGER